MTVGLLSVVVTIVDGGATLRRCLRSLTTQVDAPPVEIIVPCDVTANVSTLPIEFPQVTFLDVGSLPTRRPPLSAGGQHELFDRRRLWVLTVVNTWSRVCACVDQRLPWK